MKKLKEIDQRQKNNLLIECNCGFNHFIDFDFYVDDSKWEDTDEKAKKKYKKRIGWKHYYISFIDQKDGFWWKLKDCYNYLFSRKAQICYTGIGITSKDMDKIKKHFEKYQQL